MNGFSYYLSDGGNCSKPTMTGALGIRCARRGLRTMRCAVRFGVMRAGRFVRASTMIRAQRAQVGHAGFVPVSAPHSKHLPMSFTIWTGF